MSEDTEVGKEGSGTVPGSQSADGSGPPESGESQTQDGNRGDASEEESTISKKDYEEAQRLLGKQGKELGELRTTFDELSPLLERLQSQPAIVEAVLNGKLDSELAKAVLDGKVTVGDAEAVTGAHAEVKKDMGNKEYGKASPEDIEKRIMEKLEPKLNEQMATFQKGLSNVEARRDFERSVEKFVEETPDFEVYADAITEWLKENEGQYDVQVAYEAVKGREVLAKSKEDAEVKAAEEAKKVAANAGGGAGATLGEVEQKQIVDELIAPQSDANLF